MRDARHIDKFMYVLAPSPFYEPLSTPYYVPEPGFHEVVGQIIRRETNGNPEPLVATPEGLWIHVHTRRSADLPAEGWKIHVSATIDNAEQILRKAADVLIAQRTPFKFLADRYILEILNSKRAPRGSSGKFITVYPADDVEFRELLGSLGRILGAFEGPHILSDRQHGGSGVIYYRYGGILPRYRLDIRGVKLPFLRSPNGDQPVDERTPYYDLPTWIAEPSWLSSSEDIDNADDEDAASDDVTLNDGRYLVEESLHFSNMGGVYRALDRATGRSVVVKEARPLTCTDRFGNEAVQLLAAEHDCLLRLTSVPHLAHPVDFFAEGGHSFLVTEHIDGIEPRLHFMESNPLFRTRPTKEHTENFFREWSAVVGGLAKAVHQVHEHGFVIGDLSPTNLLIQADPPRVRVIDLEGASRVGSRSPRVFTPGFRDPTRSADPDQQPRDDCYSVAMIAAYCLFPITSLSSLRSDYLEKVVPGITRDLGWPPAIGDAIMDLRDGTISLGQFRTVIEAVPSIGAPSFDTSFSDVDIRRAVEGIADHILSAAERSRPDCLFPGDPFMHSTNPLSLGFGAIGVLYSLKMCGFDLPKNAEPWLSRAIQGLSSEDYPPGFLTGLAGIALGLWHLGHEDAAIRAADLAVRHPLLQTHHSLYYGMAGVAWTCLHFHRLTGEDAYLRRAVEIADNLIARCQNNEQGMYWQDADRGDRVYVGYGYGQAGVALLMHAVHRGTGQDKYLHAAHQALAHDLAQGVSVEPAVVSFPGERSALTLEQYVEEGSAGLLKVMVRLGLDTDLDEVARDAARKYSVFPGMLFGLAGQADALIDAHQQTGRNEFRKLARLPIAGLSLMYLMRAGAGVGVPGDHLLRLSYDYGTGAAGVMRVLHRYLSNGEPDFMLDELSPGPV